MIISNTEKQILQKYYVDRIKSLSQNLKEIILRDKQDALADRLANIQESAQRILQIQTEWRNDTTVGVRHNTVIFNEAEKLEQEVENVYEK